MEGKNFGHPELEGDCERDKHTDRFLKMYELLKPKYEKEQLPGLIAQRADVGTNVITQWNDIKESRRAPSSGIRKSILAAMEDLLANAPAENLKPKIESTPKTVPAIKKGTKPSETKQEVRKQLTQDEYAELFRKLRDEKKVE